MSAFDAASGAQLWSTALPPSVNVYGSPAVAGGEVVIATDGGLFALDAASGAVLWNVSGDSSYATPVLANGLVYTTGGAGHGDLEVLDAATGALRWEGYPYGGGAYAEGTVTLAAGKVYYASSDSNQAVVTAFSAAGCGTTPCVPSWTTRLSGSLVAEAPVVSGGRVFVGAGSGFFALDASTGTTLWSASLTGTVLAPAVAANGVVYVGTNAAALYAFPTGTCSASCSPLWQHAFPSPLSQSNDSGIVRPVAPANGLLYVPTAEGNLYVLEGGSVQSAPETAIQSGPSGDETGSGQVMVYFDSDQPGATFQCSQDGAAWSSCSSPTAISVGGPGSHSFGVRAVGANGDVDRTPATRLWTVSGTASPPDTAITSGPSSPTTDTSATFRFTSTPAGASFECALDGSAFTACTTPVSYTNLSAASHTFAVRAVNSDGTDPTPASATWTIQPTNTAAPPDTSITSGPAASTTATTATFSFASTANNATFQCALDGSAFTTCTSPLSYTLPTGTHTFQVYAVDSSGDADPTPAQETWTIQPTSSTPPPPPPTPAPPAPPTSGGSGGGSGGSSGLPPDLHVDVHSSNTTAPVAGAGLDYTIVVSSKNAGGSSDVRLDLTLPVGYQPTRIYADRGPGCTGTPPTLSCDVASINPTSTTTVQISGTAGVGEQDLTATVTSQLEPEFDPSDNTTTLKLAPVQPPPTQPPTPPSNGVAGSHTTLHVRLIGQARTGHTLRATTQPATGRFHYNWRLCAHRCIGLTVTTPSIRIQRKWLGERIRVTVTALNGGSTTTTTSKPIQR